MLSTHPDAVYVLGSICSLVLVWSGVSKLVQGPAAFEETLYQQRLMPSMLQRFVAFVLPPFEFTVGLVSLLFLGSRYGRAIFLIVALLFALFAGYLVLILGTGRKVACGCLSGSSHEPTTKYHLIRALILTLVAVIGAVNVASSPPIVVRLVLSLSGIATVTLLTILPTFADLDRRIRAELSQVQSS